MADVTKFSPKINGDDPATAWTPREALMFALSVCDDFSRVVIVLADVEEDTSTRWRRIQAGTTSAFERMGILHTANTLEDE
jgi:hypothetical protein